MFETKEIHTRNLKSAWLESGSVEAKHVIFFIHGFPDTAAIWNSQLKFFSEHSYFCMAPFNRGVSPSESSSDKNRFKLAAIVMDFLAILKEKFPKKLPSITVVGHDIGGILAWELARHIQENLAGLVIINSADKWQILSRLSTDKSQWLKSWYVWLLCTPKIPQTLLRRYPYFFLKTAYRLGGLEKQVQPTHQESLQGVVQASKYYPSLVKEIFSLKFSNSKRPPKIKNNLLQIFCTKDPFLSEPTTKELKPLIENFEIYRMHSGHWPQKEKPVELNQLILERIQTWTDCKTLSKLPS